MQHPPRPLWNTGADSATANQGGYHTAQYQEPFGGTSRDRQAIQNFDQSGTHGMQGYAPSGPGPLSQVSGINNPFAPSQPQWQPEQRTGYQTTAQQFPSAERGTSGPPDPFFGSYPTPQGTGHTPGVLPGTGFPATRDVPSAHSQPEMHAHPTLANQMSRSHSQQAAVFQHGNSVPNATGHSPFHGYTSHSSASQGQYPGPHMAPTQSGAGFNPAMFPAAPDHQGSARYYQNPLVQASVHQYLPQHRSGQYAGSTAHPAAGQSDQTGQTSGQQNQWTNTGTRSSRAAASDPQFISGPWASSTPPTSGPPAPSPHG